VGVSRWLPDVLKGDRGRKGLQGIPGPPGPPDYSLLPQWRDLVAIDFSAQPNQVIAADGLVTIGGIDWTVKNFANQAGGSVFSVENGRGLRLGASSVTGQTPIFTSSRTTPRVLLPLSQWPVVNNETPLRAVAELFSVHSDSDSYRTLFGLLFENNTDNTRSNSVYHVCGNASSDGSEQDVTWVSNFYRGAVSASAQRSTEAGVLPISCNAVGLWMPDGLPGTKTKTYGVAPSSVDAWTDPTQLASACSDGAPFTSGTSSSWSELQASRWWVSLCAGVETGGGSKRYPIVKKFRLQAWYGVVP
jgi:hypothetical protein